jgi:hypothetical protein
MSCPSTVHPAPLQQSVSLNLGLGRWTASPGELPVSASLDAEDLNLGLQDCTASTLYSEPPPQFLSSPLRSRDSQLPSMYILGNFYSLWSFLPGEWSKAGGRVC